MPATTTAGQDEAEVVGIGDRPAGSRDMVAEEGDEADKAGYGRGGNHDRDKRVGPAPITFDRLEHEEVEGSEGQVTQRSHERSLVAPRHDNRHADPEEKSD